MSAFILGVFGNYEVAERVRIELFRDGFPTDRVELTAACDPGRAAFEPASSLHDKFAQYLRTLFEREDEQGYPELLAQRIDNGAAIITVHPRGAIETARAIDILKNAHPMDLIQHDLARQGWEYAASSAASPWIRNFWVDSTNKADCIYCRLFERPHPH